MVLQSCGPLAMTSHSSLFQDSLFSKSHQSESFVLLLATHQHTSQCQSPNDSIHFYSFIQPKWQFVWHPMSLIKANQLIYSSSEDVSLRHLPCKHCDSHALQSSHIPNAKSDDLSHTTDWHVLASLLSQHASPPDSQKPQLQSMHMRTGHIWHIVFVGHASQGFIVCVQVQSCFMNMPVGHVLGGHGREMCVMIL